jgi:nicotinamide riboside transporter PnuC
MKKEYMTVMTQGEDLNCLVLFFYLKETYGLVIWLDTKDQKKANKLAKAIIKKLNK